MMERYTVNLSYKSDEDLKAGTIVRKITEVLYSVPALSVEVISLKKSSDGFKAKCTISARKTLSLDELTRTLELSKQELVEFEINGSLTFGSVDNPSRYKNYDPKSIRIFQFRLR